MADFDFKLNNGVTIPGLGFGTFANEGAKGESYKAVIHALKVGYRHLDCAAFYMNEEEVGDAIRDFLKETPSVKREDLFICTKVWNHLHEPDEVQWSFENSLKKLKLDYVDLFLIHWPIAAERNDDYSVKVGPDAKYIIKKQLTDDPKPTWQAVEAIYESGKTKAIGISNWTIPQLDKLLKYAKVKPQVNQVEIHPFLPNNDLVKYCLDHDILPEAYSPLGSQNQVPSTGEKVNTNPTLKDIAEKSGYTLAQVLLAWGLRRGYAVLPKSSTPSRIESNFQVPKLTDEEYAAVNKVAEGRHTRFVNMKDTFGYDNWPEEATA
ncbi:MAG: Glycerol 2-dehydrogenase (NADP(+)) [Cirrosporium novae-zelandiae]|nr:MAG: Glycerol 2-dehydrogenase (NADP(+)) [Cirrosporium novae-zelandiae]